MEICLRNPKHYRPTNCLILTSGHLPPNPHSVFLHSVFASFPVPLWKDRMNLAPLVTQRDGPASSFAQLHSTMCAEVKMQNKVFYVTHLIVTTTMKQPCSDMCYRYWLS